MTLALVVGCCVAIAWQARETLRLRAELEVARLEAAESESLRAENQRLRAKQIPAAELEALRADHAAVLRLRAELESLRKPAPAP